MPTTAQTFSPEPLLSRLLPSQHISAPSPVELKTIPQAWPLSGAHSHCPGVSSACAQCSEQVRILLHPLLTNHPSSPTGVDSSVTSSVKSPYPPPPRSGPPCPVFPQRIPHPLPLTPSQQPYQRSGHMFSSCLSRWGFFKGRNHTCCILLAVLPCIPHFSSLPPFSSLLPSTNIQ